MTSSSFAHFLRSRSPIVPARPNSSEKAAKMKSVVRSHPALRIIGSPTFCFSFTSDEFDIYHVADFMRERGWRFNGQQYPNAIHMAVTGPQTRL